jgi:hypothetical protein
MHTTVAFNRNSGAAVETFTELTPCADQSHHIEGTTLYVGENNKVTHAVAIGAQVDRARLDAPTLRRVCLPSISPVDPNAEPQSKSVGLLMPESPLVIEVGEGLKVLTDNNAAAAARSTVILNLSSEGLAKVVGEIFTLRYTASTTLTAFAWTNCVLTADQTLPVGTYAVVGAKFQSAGCLAGRLVIPGVFVRPGGVGGDTYDAEGLPGQRFGGWGEWCRFDWTTPPSADFLSISADTAEYVYLDLIKV